MKFMKLDVFLSVMVYNSSALTCMLMIAPSEELQEIDFASSLCRKQSIIKHCFLECPFRAKESLHRSLNGFVI